MTQKEGKCDKKEIKNREKDFTSFSLFFYFFYHIFLLSEGRKIEGKGKEMKRMKTIK